ncbi:MULTISPECIES: hypothetical protein [Bacillaceae]|nr:MULTISPECIES: hypothetical protein [Bacillaceae]MDX8367127.1 hypothetical protein [Cytobacillus sp. IB215665]
MGTYSPPCQVVFFADYTHTLVQKVTSLFSYMLAVVISATGRYPPINR